MRVGRAGISLKAFLLSATLLAAPYGVRAERNTVIDGNDGTLPLPTGQFVTPQVLSGVLQQPLNPGLPAYPNFVAGEAVRSQLSPDATTLAIICAGQNSLYMPSGTVDTANSTQYIEERFLLSGAVRRRCQERAAAGPRR